MKRQSTRVPAPPPRPPSSSREPQSETSAEHAATLPHSTAAYSLIQDHWTDKAANPEFWGVDPRPRGGFVSYLQNPSSYPLPQQPPNQQAMLQQFYYSGGPSHYAPCPAPRPSVATRNPSPSVSEPRIPVTPSGSQQTINVDNGAEEGEKRTEKRLAWTSQEDVRLMSAWLRCSTDPINGNNKKRDQYWGDVTNVYNSTTPKNRRREVKQAKDHWHSLNKLVFQFHCSWTKASAIYASGQSDAQLLEKAQAFYQDDYKAQFHHMDCWRAVNEQTKWTTYNEWLEQSKKRKTPETGEKGMHAPGTEDVEDIPRPTRGFPGMLGSIDCMHWPWEKCPNAWRGQFTRGDHGVPTMILEAVASQDLRIWHAYFGVAGSNNDINVLNKSHLFVKDLKGEAPQVQFTVNGNQYNRGYYLADGIYPEWAVFVKTIPLPQTEIDKLFARHQEGARKDVERAFGVLQSRFNIVRRPSRLWKRSSVGKIMEACIILHNMIVEDEGEMIHIPLDLNENPGTYFALPPEVNRGPNICFTDVLQRNSSIRARPTHQKLKQDLVEHIWEKFGY